MSAYSRQAMRCEVGLTLFEGCHGKYTREDTLIVTVKQTTQAGETCDTKDLQVLDQGHRSGGTREGLAARQSGGLEFRSSTTDRSHVDEYRSGVVSKGRGYRSSRSLARSFNHSTRSDDRSMQGGKKATRQDPCWDSKVPRRWTGTQPLHICTPTMPRVPRTLRKQYRTPVSGKVGPEWLHVAKLSCSG
jgi:hypothetical protein